MIWLAWVGAVALICKAHQRERALLRRAWLVEQVGPAPLSNVRKMPR